MGYVSVHEALRPSWECAGCGAPWPCPTRRRQLRAEYIRGLPELSALMGWYLSQAQADVPGASPAGLDARFVGWIEADDLAS
jgi:hypothetical protein